MFDNHFAKGVSDYNFLLPSPLLPKEISWTNTCIRPLVSNHLPINQKDMFIQPCLKFNGGKVPLKLGHAWVKRPLIITTQSVFKITNNQKKVRGVWHCSQNCTSCCQNDCGSVPVDLTHIMRLFQWLMAKFTTNVPGVGVTKPISSVPLFFRYFSIVKTEVSYRIARLYLTGVAVAQLRWHLSNMNVIQRI